MRRLLVSIAVAGVLSLQSQARADEGESGDEEAQQNAQVSEQQFQEQLSPYGQWEYDNTYGQVFYPAVDHGWRPYVYGRWVWTDGGWMWMSDEPYGWAVYHYGRWWFNPWQHRWGWVPGYEWAPAWVVWRFGGGHVGWAPLYVGYDGWTDDYPIYYDHWVYVPTEHFYGGPVYSYVYSPAFVRSVFYSTSVVHGYVGTTSYGPPTTYVAAHSATPIVTTTVVHSAAPPTAGSASTWQGGEAPVYLPPGTHLYNPTRPAPPAIRGQGASHVPVVAPPSTHVPSASPPERGGPSYPGPRGNAPENNPRLPTYGAPTHPPSTKQPPPNAPKAGTKHGPTTAPRGPTHGFNGPGLAPRRQLVASAQQPSVRTPVPR